jgi:hypothetical protein
LRSPTRDGVPAIGSADWWDPERRPQRWIFLTLLVFSSEQSGSDPTVSGEVRLWFFVILPWMLLRLREVGGGASVLAMARDLIASPPIGDRAGR